MKNFCTRITLSMLLITASVHLSAQCTNYKIDWDYRDFFARNNSTIRSYVSLAQSQTQYFSFGANKLTINHNYTADASIAGDNLTNTAEAGSYGSGADVEFTGNGVITLTFQAAVSNLKFSMYDIDRNQRVTFGALDGATARNISLSTISGSTLTITNNNSANARVDANNTTVSNSNTNGTINVDITGPVTTVTITVTNTGTCSSSCGTGGSETGQFWISDITACSSGSFPNNYYAPSRPFTGMPNYVLVVRNNEFMYVNPANGQSFPIFTDNTHTNMNSIAYDPVNRYIYYTYSLSGSGGTVNPNEKRIRRYDMNMDTFGVVVSDITALGIPTYQQGVESGAAAFYNGNLYFGVEGGQYTESTVWRLEMNSSNIPVGFSQVYAQVSTSSDGTGTSRVHDWADFGVSNGVLYDFDGGRVSDGSNTDFYHQNLLTGAVTNYTPPLTVPRQTGVDWQGNVYNIGSSGGALVNGTIGLYNGTTNETGTVNISRNGVDYVGGSWGDAGEAFRPNCDFGDAPLSYEGADPVLAPAVHERHDSIFLGTGWSKEWLKRGVTAANDTYDDALAYAPILPPGGGGYSARATVWNRNTVNARLIAWLDYNGNGVFDATEAITPITVPPAAGPQNFWLIWPSTPNPFVNGQYTYLRLRITADSAGMTSADPTGYFANGEVEDYRVLIDNFPLSISSLSFNAKAVGNKRAEINWVTGSEENMAWYEVEKSLDNDTWTKLTEVAAKGNGLNKQTTYTFMDENPSPGLSYYRLKIVNANGKVTYSEVRRITIQSLFGQVTLNPTPARDKIWLRLNTAKSVTTKLFIVDLSGRIVLEKQLQLNKGYSENEINLDKIQSSGMYILQLKTDGELFRQKIMISRN